jgi:hypothetical protein
MSIPVEPPNTFEYPDQVFGRDVPGGAGREWTAGEPCERSIEDPQTLAIGGIQVGEAETVRVMGVKGRGCHIQKALAGGREKLRDMRGVGPPRRVARAELVWRSWAPRRSL